MIVNDCCRDKDRGRGKADGFPLSNDDWAVLIDIRNFDTYGSVAVFPEPSETAKHIGCWDK